MSDINITIRLASKAATDGLTKFGGASKKAGEKLDLFDRAARQANRSLNSFVGNLGANLAFRAFNGIITGIGNTVQNLRDFETALVGVGKTTGLAGKELAVLGDRIEKLSTEIPVSSTELLGLAKTAAQLGVEGSDNIVKFTDTMARLAASTDIVGESGAIAFARIINITGDSVDNIDKLGSTIVALGNKFATTESQILTVSNEVAKGAARFGLSAQEVLGLSTALSALGVEAQVGGSSLQRIFSDVEQAIGKGGSELAKFTDILGITDKEFIDLFKTNPQKFFQELVIGIERTSKEGKDLSTIFAELGFNDKRLTKTLGPLVKNTDLLTRAINLQNDAYSKNTALADESAAAFDTLDSDIQDFSNTFTALTNTLLRAVLPAIRAVVKGFTSFIELLLRNKDFIITFGQVATAAVLSIGAGFVASSAAALGFSAVLTIVKLNAIAMWLAITGPVGLAIAGITAVTVAIRTLADTTDRERLSALEGARERRRQNGLTTESIDEQITTLKSKIAIEETNARIAKGGAEGTNTVLKEATKSARKLNLALIDQAGLRLQLNSITGQVSSPEGANVLRLQKDIAFELEAAKTKQQNELNILNQTAGLKRELKLAELEEKFLLDGQIDESEQLALLLTEDRLKRETETRQLELTKQLKDKETAEKLRLKIETDQARRSNEIKKRLGKIEEDRKKKAIKDEKEFQDSLLIASKLGGAKLFKAVQSFQIAQATVAGITAVSQAASALPFPANIPGIVIETARAVTNVSQIKSQSPGFQDGGIVPGNSFSGDNVQANVNSGEMILNRQQQAQLFQQANGRFDDNNQGSAGDIVVQIDGEEVFRAVSRQVANGGVLGEGGV